MLNYTLVIEIEISKIYSLSIVVGIYIASNQIRMTTAANNHKARLIYIFMRRKHFIMYFPSQQVNLQFNLNIITLCYLDDNFDREASNNKDTTEKSDHYIACKQLQQIHYSQRVLYWVKFQLIY